MAYKKRNLKPGPPKKMHPYELARQIVQTQGITSKVDYERWWNYNLPRDIPKKPDIVYKRDNNGWVSWSDFLGITNKFPYKKVKFRSYEDCKKYTYPLGLRNSLEWFKFCKSPNKPADIPNAPMHYYRKKGVWVSWKDFLGYDLANRVDYLIKNKKPILYVAKVPDRPFNVFKINVLMGEKEDLIDLQKRTNIQFIRCFYLNRVEDDWKAIVGNNITPYMGEEDEFSTPNIADIISELSYSFDSVK